MPIPINQISIPSVQRTDTTVQANPAAATAPARAAQQFGAAVGQVGQAQEQFQKAKFAGQAAALEDNLTTSFEEYKLEMEREPDEQKWLNGWNERANEIRKQSIDESTLPEKQKIALGVEFDARNKRNQIEVAGLTQKREIQRSKAQLMGAAETNLENGDLEGYEQKIKAGVELGLIFPEEEQKLLSAGEERMDYYEVISLIETDPRQAEELLTDQTETGRWREFKNLSPNTRKSLIGASRQKAIDGQIDLFNDMTLGIQEGNLIHPDAVIQMAKNGKLTSGQATNYIRQYHSAVPASFDPVSYADLLTRVNAYDPKDDPSRLGYSKLYGEVIGQPSGAVSDLRNRLEDRLTARTPGGQAKSKSSRSAALGELSRLNSKNFFSNGFEPTSNEQRLAASEKYLSVVDTVERLASQHENVTSQELLTMALKEPENVDIQIEKAKEIQAGLQSIQPTREQSEEAFKKFQFGLFKTQFPSIDPDMSREEAVEAAAKDAGGSLTRDQLRDLQRLFR